MKTTETNLISFALLLNRLALGVLFMLAGVRKLLPTAEASTLDKMHGFAAYVASSAPLPESLGKAYGYALPWGEIIVGVLLILGLLSRLSAFCIALMLVSFIVAMGTDWWPDSGPAFTKNFILLTLALLLTVTGSGKIAVRPDGPLK